MCDLEAFGHECSSSGVEQCEDGIEGVIEHEMCARMSEGCRWLSLYMKQRRASAAGATRRP
jgi:hypothetical protein